MNALVEVLRRARARLAVPGQWTKRAYGRTEDGKLSLARFERCVCWCAAGAVRAEVYADGARTNPEPFNEWAPLEPLRETLRARGLDTDIATFNDAQDSVEPVLALYDETIARLDAEVRS